MKILHVPHAYAPVFGGVETQIRAVGECLASKGHQVKVFTTNVSSADAYYRPARPVLACPTETLNGVPITRVPYGNRATRALLRTFWQVPAGFGRSIPITLTQHYCDMKVLKSLKRCIDAWRPEVVVTLPHLVRNVEIVLRARESLNFPLVMIPMLHEFDPDWPYQAMVRALKFADAVIAMTAWERDRLISAYGVPSQKVFVGGNGVDIFGPSLAGAGNEFTVTYLGRKTLRKGISLLLQAMSIVWQSAPNIKLVLAGAQSFDREEIQKIIGSLPIQQQCNIRSVDDISDAEKSTILSKSNLLALPSSIESFGIVILEAWGHGVPVVTFDLPVFRSIIDDGVDGFLIAGSAEALAKCILYGQRNRLALQTMGERGCQKATTQYSWHSVAHRFLEAYKFGATNAGSNSLA